MRPIDGASAVLKIHIRSEISIGIGLQLASPPPPVHYSVQHIQQ